MSDEQNKPEKKTLFIIDVMPFLYRGHFVFLRNPRVTSTGITTSALIGFANGPETKEWVGFFTYQLSDLENKKPETAE